MPSTLCGDLRAAQDETDLRTIAMTDGHIPAGFDHIGDVIGSFLGSLVLILNGLMFFILDQRIAADGDDSYFFSSYNYASINPS